MLISFSVENYRSIRTRQTLDMRATMFREHEEALIMRGKRLKLLPMAVFYGANSSGKSNMLSAIGAMRHIVLSSVKLNPGDKLHYDPFALIVGTDCLPTVFEIEFYIDDNKYRYGFIYDRRSIHEEWLHEKRDGEKEIQLFERKGTDIVTAPVRFSEGKGMKNAIVDNRLYLSLVAQLNGELSKKIIRWFKNLRVLSGLGGSYEGYASMMLSQESELSKKAMQLMRRLDLGFDDIKVEERELDDVYLQEQEVPEQIRKRILEQIGGKKVQETFTVHTIMNKDGKEIGKRNFKESEMESEGTKKVIMMSCLIVETLSKGTTLVVDEFEAKLHPILTRALVNLFMEKEANPHGAQLIFSSHDVVLLDPKFLRRDQIWMVEKDDLDSSVLKRLSDIKDDKGVKIRNDRNIQKDYLSGGLGGVPVIEE